MERFSTASVSARVNGLLDLASFEPLVGPASRAALIAGGGRLEGEPVWIAATDPTRARGALGVAEADALCALFQTARRAPRPLLLLIDSAGAKVDEGLAALGAFRRLFREALLTRLARVPMVAPLGRSCFGGASMLACLCGLRLYSSQTLLGVSGPGVIEALGGKGELNAADSDEVRALMGGEARTRLGPSEQLTADDVIGFRDALVRLLRQGPAGSGTVDWMAQHSGLGRRLARRATDDTSLKRDQALSGRRLQQLLPPGYVPASRGPVCLALPPADSERPAFLGLLSGGVVGAEACWQLADVLFELHRSNPKSPILLVLDAAGHAATRREEASMLSAYLAHLSLTLGWLAQCGHEVSLWIAGAAAGAVYVAFAAPAERVSALHSARIRILPEAAVRRILGASTEQPADPDALLHTGVIDAFLDRRFEGYAAVADGG
ncbi:MAG TPA: biotin-independent malonate decarboxylase subunit gamma [Burkholderiales bacterium]|nr:biotin-independent malonate decarboxylase subunit gamma [Burkholderiales bacterium]